MSNHIKSRMPAFVSFILFIFLCLATPVLAEDQIVNVYAWTGEIPDFIVRKFERETGIHVNFSTYQNNEIMYTKLRTTKNAGYDVVMPSSYFVDRMSRQDMLAKLDKSKLPNWKNLNPTFLNLPHDPGSNYAVPFIWGMTGIFCNTKYYDKNKIVNWTDLWNKEYRNQLMLLDDTREVFAVALLALGYSPSDTNPEHIKQAYLKLKELIPNIKVFSTETVISIMLDEDATLGMAWNGDTYKAMQENKDLTFIYPKDGFVIWIDSFSIPKNARHPKEAYAFINFMMRADVARDVALYSNYPITNKTALAMLPPNIRNNKTIYPPASILKHGSVQTDVGEATLALYEKYWEELKMSS